MRECWINVYPGLVDDVSPVAILGSMCPDRECANEAAIGAYMCDCFAPVLGKRLRAAGVGYRLHVRLKPSRLDGLEDMARQMMTSPDPLMRERGETRLKMIEAARAKGVR